MSKMFTCVFLTCFLFLSIFISSFNCKSKLKLRSFNKNDKKSLSKVNNLLQIQKKAPASDSKKTDNSEAKTDNSEAKTSDDKKPEDDSSKKEDSKKPAAAIKKVEEKKSKNEETKKSSTSKDKKETSGDTKKENSKDSEDKNEKKNTKDATSPKKLKVTKAKREITLTSDNPNTDTKPDYTKASNINCTQTNCQYPNVCLPDNKTCRCAPNMAEFELNRPRVDSEKIEVYCAYTRKNQLVYFLLEFLINIGAGHLYAGNKVKGAIKMTLVFLPCLAFMLMMCLGVMSSSKIAETASFGYCIAVAAVCAVSVWWLVDIIMIALRNYTDGNGVPLKSW